LLEGAGVGPLEIESGSEPRRYGMSRFLLGLALILAFLVTLPGTALANLTVTQAELSGDRLRIEGSGAAPGATITVDGIAMGEADGNGDFRIEQEPFSSATCEVEVSDGSASVTVTLDGCTPEEETGDGASFQGLGSLPLKASGVSGDGVVLVGSSNGRPARWTAETGIEDLGTLGGEGGSAADASFDGTWVVGTSDADPDTTDCGSPCTKGFRWSTATGMEELPMGSAREVSDDGSVVVGAGRRWKDGEVTILGGEEVVHVVHGVSGDGVFVVGWFAPDGDRRAFRWSEAGGSENLGTLKDAEQGFHNGESSRKARTRMGRWSSVRPGTRMISGGPSSGCREASIWRTWGTSAAPWPPPSPPPPTDR
jgi:hypothetical protein